MMQGFSKMTSWQTIVLLCTSYLDIARDDSLKATIIGAIYSSQGDYEKVLEFYKKALDIQL